MKISEQLLHCRYLQLIQILSHRVNNPTIDLQKAQLEKEAEEDSQYRQQLEQERRDHELALRLAQESNSTVDDSPLLMRK